MHDFRATYGVTDYRWFNLRDSDTASPQLFQRAGLIESDYDRKPAFGAYERLIEGLSIRGGLATTPARLALRLRYRRGRSRRGRPLRARPGPGHRHRRRPRAWPGGRTSAAVGAGVARDTRPPLSRIVDRGRHRGRSHRHAVVAKVRLADGGLVRLRRRLPRLRERAAARVRVRA